MKKILIAFSVLMIAVTVNAQKKKCCSIGLGFKAGTNFAKYVGHDVSTQTVLKPYIGTSVNFKFSDKFLVKQEILFSSEGSQSGTDADKERFTTAYLALPLMLQLNISKSIFLETGPQVNILIKAEHHMADLTTDIKDTYQPATIGWDLGIGAKLKSGFGLNARYAAAFGNIFKDQPISAHSSVISIGFFYNLWNK